MDELGETFKNCEPSKFYMSFDTETTGLNFEELELVGYSYCLDGKTAYYVPIYHFEYEHNLGEEAVEYIYNKMCEATKVFMYNARYDMRVFEFRGYKENKDKLKDKRFKYVKYDMSKVNYYDVAVAVFAADSNIPLPSLKFCHAEDTVVDLVEGRKLIKDVEVGDSIKIGDSTFSILGVDCKGERDLIRVVFEDGYSVECTEDHKFLSIINNSYCWIKAKDLMNSDCEVVTKDDIESMSIDNQRFLYEWIVKSNIHI